MEEWKVIENYPMYEVSSEGRVRSYYNGSHGKRTVPKILSLKVDRIGYTFVHLKNDLGRKPFRVHRLVAKSFIPNPSGLPEVNHKDEDKSNNSVHNLEWCEKLYNIRYSKVWKSNERSVLQYTKEGTLVREYNSLSEAARLNNVTPQSIFAAIKNNWCSADSRWKYKEEG